ncbi:MAG: ROK family protein [Candidatus Omnitrophota bacterium]
MSRFVLGIDVGGTNIKCGLVDPSGKISLRTAFPTKSFAQSKSALIKALVSCAQKTITQNDIGKKDILGIGIGFPGLVDFPKGMVHCLVNIPGWKNVFVKKIIQQEIGIPTFVDNDVNLMALGEWKFGAGRGVKNVVCITLGTGVGGGLIINNALYRGEGFSAGEIGHTPINENGPRCNCGGTGCLERYVGNKYLLEKSKKIFRGKTISFPEITRLAAKGNRKAIAFWEEVGFHLGIGLTGVVNILNPDRIVIGGGVSNNHRYLFPAIKKTILQRAMKIPARMAKIVKAQLGEDAGIIGAQVLVNHAVSAK